MSMKTIRGWILLLCCLLPLTLAAQGSLLKGLGGMSPAAPSGGDPFGRTTPRATLLGFLDAAQKNDTQRALNYLELNKQAREVDGPKLVGELELLLNRAYIGRLQAVSDQPNPSGNPALKPDQELCGEFSAGGKQIELVLVRVAEPNSGNVWLVSWQTL